MNKQITVAIAGLGNRGKDTYAQVAKLIPDKMKIVAVADINEEKVKLAAKEFDIPAENCFKSAEEMLEKDMLADVMVIATQDRQHVGHAIPALRKGYHLLLEKPISPILKECQELVKVAKECDRKVVVCHVLRYTPVYQKVKELLDAGTIGEVVSIMALENVGWWHQAHSFVRGNWRNKELSSPMILQKCCHDMDLYLWLANKECKSLSSFGSIHLFKEECAPEGCAKRCLEGCEAKENCCFDAEKIYIKHKTKGYESGNREWPLNVLVTGKVTEKALMNALKTGPYGRCVYHCDNNVVDHQVLNMLMTDGTTMSFTMCGFSADVSRYAKFMGTKGELIVNMNGDDIAHNVINVRLFDTVNTEYSIDVADLSSDFSGHGGGDNAMVEEFIDVLCGIKDESPYVTSLEKSMESHYCALAAEESRLNGGKIVELEDLV